MQHPEIETVTPREHVQLRPYVYAGDCADATQLMIEILGNSIDEFNLGVGKEILVKVDNKNHLYTVQDSGRGFPPNEIREEDGETILQASFDVLNTSGKFREDGSYAGVSIGKNGQGGKITNFLSDFFEVFSWRKQGSEHLWFENGIFIKRETDKKPLNDTSGTIIKFVPSEKYFTSPVVNLSTITTFCDDITCLCKGLKIILNDKEYYHENGIADMLDKNIGDSITLLQNNIYGDFQEGKQKMEFGMTYTASSSSKVISYVNCGATSLGPHLSTIKSSITRVLNKWARENGFLKKNEKNIEGSCLQEGLVFVSNITAENVGYDAQIKTTVTKIDTQFISKFSRYLEIYLDNNPNDGKIIIEQALTAKRASEAAKKAREAVKNKNKNKDKVFKLPTSLTDCWGKDRSKCELFISEGKSSASGLVASRNSATQAVYGIRGKTLSIRKVAPESILKNQEINNIIQALGLDYDPKTAKCVYDKDKLRYGKIIAAADADFDGPSKWPVMFLQ